MEKIVYVLVALYLGGFVLTLTRLLQKKRPPLVSAVVSLLWPFTLFWGLRIAERMESKAAENEVFHLYRAAGFDTLKVKNGNWIAGYSVADMDRGGHLILVIPGFEAAPEDLQEVIAQPCSSPREAIFDSAKRNMSWQKRPKGQVNEKTRTDVN